MVVLFMVEELLLGDNPFIGVSHMSHEKAREERGEASIENKVSVIEAAVKGGATGFTFSTCALNLELLRYLRDNRPRIFESLNYYVLVPYAAQYVREATSAGTVQLIKRVLAGNISLKGLSFALWPRPVNLIKMFLQVELKEYLDILPRERVKAVLLHEVLTELIVAFNLCHMVKELICHFQRRGLSFGFETRNVGNLRYFLKNNKITVEYVMTPLNPIGYQMSPSKKKAEESIIKLSTKGIKIIAINVLASGTVSPQQAMEYLSQFKECIFAVTVGTSKANRALENFRVLSMLNTEKYPNV